MTSFQRGNVNTVCCSAPGKVLLTGGYLVLERPNSGIVLTVNARFYTTITQLQHTLHPHHHHTHNDSPPRIIVRSPQFDTLFEYHVSCANQTFSITPISSSQKENKYIEKPLLYTLLATGGLIGFVEVVTNLSLSGGLMIEILGDNDFYSQSKQLTERGLPPCSDSLKSLPHFLRVNSSLQDVPKTGLGSSAALVTSLTAAILSYFKAVDLSLPQGKIFICIVHNLAQFSHCSAQGKVGSGFDVSSAVYGSQIYVRFSPNIISDLLKQCDEGTPSCSQVLGEITKNDWDNKVTPFSLPPGLSLILGDVSIGSNTPSMVRKILDWKSTKPDEALSVWKQVAEANSKVETQLKLLHEYAKIHVDQYEKQLATCVSQEDIGWKSLGVVGQHLHNCRMAFLEVRAGLRLMGELADVPLEPPPQTRLADATMNVRGVLAAGVPGAGGFDAMYAIVLSPISIQNVEDLWTNWVEMKVLPLILREDANGVCLDTLKLTTPVT